MKINEEYIGKSENPKEAEHIFTLMRLDEVLISLLGCVNKDKEGPYKVKKEIYLRLLKEQLEQLK